MTDDTLLHRQVHPSWVQAGRITSQSFKPTPKDRDKLSVYDGDQITASASWNHHTETLKLQSAGVMSVTVAECLAIELSVSPDPDPFPEHAVICFDDLSNSQMEKKAKRLKKFATDRDWQYQAEASL